MRRSEGVGRVDAALKGRRTVGQDGVGERADESAPKGVAATKPAFAGSPPNSASQAGEAICAAGGRLAGGFTRRGS